MICSRCREENREEARFCRACGASLATLCPSCGANVEAESKFCDRCGALLQATPAAPPGPAPIAGAPDSTGTRHEPRPAAEAERRQLPVIFCDLVGSTELAARLDP